ncbi:unnamed protein product [Orchesella dallaii]|uniref:Uncharacterized protein n=1 Tax=Orchesella dallaii TaxID=48710 RepID=A0ABP1Q0X6_9HEXA
MRVLNGTLHFQPPPPLQTRQYTVVKICVVMISSTTLLHSDFGDYTLTENGVMASLVTLLIIFLYVLRKNKWNNKYGSRQHIPGPGQHFLGSITNILAIRDMTSKTYHK